MNKSFRSHIEKIIDKEFKIQRITPILVIISIIVAIIGINLGSQNSENIKTSLTHIENNTKQALKIESENQVIDSANLASKYAGFRADVDYNFESINGLSNTITVENNKKDDTYLNHRLYLEVYCDNRGHVFPVDQKLINDQIRILKFEQRDSLKFNLPEGFLNSSVTSFGLRFTVVAHPYVAGIVIEDAPNNKQSIIQYVISEDGTRWRPSIVSSDGGFKCGREPYVGDVIRLDYTNEDEFLECSACK